MKRKGRVCEKNLRKGGRCDEQRAITAITTTTRFRRKSDDISFLTSHTSTLTQCLRKLTKCVRQWVHTQCLVVVTTGKQSKAKIGKGGASNWGHSKSNTLTETETKQTLTAEHTHTRRRDWINRCDQSSFGCSSQYRCWCWPLKPHSIQCKHTLSICHSSRENISLTVYIPRID